MSFPIHSTVTHVSIEETVNTFLEYGYATISIPNLRTLSRKSMDGFRHFHASEPTQDQWGFFHNGNTKDIDTGFCKRREEYNGEKGQTRDNKNWFHFRPTLYSLGQERGLPIDNHRDWFGNCQELRDTCTTVSKHFYQELDLRCPGKGLLDAFLNGRSHDNVLRMVNYLKGVKSSRGLIANPHIDRGKFSILLGENCPGLQFFINGKWLDMCSNPDRDQGVIFAGPGFKHLVSAINPIIHQVIETTVESDIVRESCVYFGAQ